MGEENICCVKCDSVLDRTTIGGVEVDLCPRCGGLWLDRGEIERVGRLPVQERIALRKRLLGDDGEAAEPSEITDVCPACHGSLKEVKLGTVIVDFCEACHGLFLDRGELDGALAGAKGQNDVAALLQAAAASLPLK